MTHFSAIFSLLWWNKTKSEISEVQVANGCILPWWNGKEKVQSGFSSKNNSYGEAKRYKVAYRQILGYWQYFVPNLCNNIAYSVLYVCALFMYYITHCTNLKSSDYVIILMKLFISHLKVKVTWSFLTLCNPMDCSLPGSSVHGILRARTLAWESILSFRASSQPRDQTQVSCVSRQILYRLRHQGSPLRIQITLGSNYLPYWRSFIVSSYSCLAVFYT